jgi:hypothetical protein
MIDINVINLVTTGLVQTKNELEYEINSLTQKENNVMGKADIIRNTLREYNQVMSDIQLWESIINDIDIDKKPEEGNNNN